MISVDNRTGSKDMAPLLSSLGVEVELVMMPFGDLCWLGNGVNGLPVSVGIEIKELADVLACITSGRFAGHQLPGLIKSYDQVYLLVNGQYRARATDGMLEIYRQGRGGGWYWGDVCGGKRNWMWRDVESWLNSVSILGGLRVQHCRDWAEGAQWIRTLYQWYRRETHKSHLVMYSGPGILTSDSALLVKPSLVRRLAAELPKIGLERSSDVAKHFKTVEEMINASEKEWMAVEGIGKGIANTVWRAIHGNANGNGIVKGGKH